MKPTITFILFSLFISNLHSQVLKDFRITKCYYDSTNLYFEYEFVANVDVVVLETKQFITTCFDESYEVAVLANKCDSIKRMTKIPCNISCFLGYDMMDIDGNLFGRNEVNIKKNKQYKMEAKVSLFDFLLHNDTASQLEGKYIIQLVQPTISLTKRFVVERRTYSEKIEIDLPDYSAEFLLKKRFNIK